MNDMAVQVWMTMFAGILLTSAVYGPVPFTDEKAVDIKQSLDRIKNDLPSINVSGIEMQEWETFLTVLTPSLMDLAKDYQEYMRKEMEVEE